MADQFGTAVTKFEVEFATIGDPGNPADMAGDLTCAGAVDYLCRMGRYGIGRKKVKEASAVGGLEITLQAMEWLHHAPRI